MVVRYHDTTVDVEYNVHGDEVWVTQVWDDDGNDITDQLDELDLEHFEEQVKNQLIEEAKAEAEMEAYFNAEMDRVLEDEAL